MNNSLFKDRDGNLSSRIIFSLINMTLSWLIVFICVFRNMNIQSGVLTFLIAITTKTGIDGISQVYQNTRDRKKEEEEEIENESSK